MRAHRRGFTFVEILVAMAVFALLSAIAVPRFRDLKERAYVATMKSDLGELRIAQESHWAENQLYTTDSTTLDWQPSSDSRVSITSIDPAGGYSATAMHTLLRGTQCDMRVGREASGVPSGEIVCGPATVTPSGT